MKALKVTGGIILFILVIIFSTGYYIKVALPDIPEAAHVVIERTPDRVERGKYLAHHVAVCMDCHSKRDWTIYSGPMSDTGMGGGGESFTKEMGFPGNFYAPNLTPYALNSWTDGEILRAVTEGVNKDGKALFPVMAYHRFGKMDKEDVMSIIAYIRTLDSFQNDIPPSNADFPVNLLLNTLPQVATFSTLPADSTSVNYGAYLVNAAGCVDCHSKLEKGKIVEGTEFRGGMEIRQPGGVLVTPNITGEPEGRLYSWSKEFFIERFKQYADSSYKPVHIAPGNINTPMPWTMYGGMKSNDLAAIYDYLKSIKQVQYSKK